MRCNVLDRPVERVIARGRGIDSRVERYGSGPVQRLAVLPGKLAPASQQVPFEVVRFALYNARLIEDLDQALG